MKRQHKNVEMNAVAKLDTCSIVHVILPKEMNDMKDKGTIFIYVNQLICEKVDNINKIRWNIIKPSEISEVATDTSNIAIVTKFKEWNSYKMLAFVGLMKKQLPRDEDHILLALILQNSMESSIESIDVQEMFCECNTTKHNINKASSNHHDGIGGVYGFGAWKDFRVDENNGSIVKPFTFKEGKDEQTQFLKDMQPRHWKVLERQ